MVKGSTAAVCTAIRSSFPLGRKPRFEMVSIKPKDSSIEEIPKEAKKKIWIRKEPLGHRDITAEIMMESTIAHITVDIAMKRVFSTGLYITGWVKALYQFKERLPALPQLLFSVKELRAMVTIGIATYRIRKTM